MGDFTKRLVHIAAIYSRCLIVYYRGLFFEPRLHFLLAHLPFIHFVDLVAKNEERYPLGIFWHRLHEEFLLPHVEVLKSFLVSDIIN